VSGTFQNLVDKYKVDPILFMGFLDGINSSLLKNIPIETFDENGQVDLTIDFEKLYFNMLEAKAEYLYTLEQWDAILTEEKRLEIFKNFKRSKTVIKEKTPGRNDPCPCGSGKKYKKCCGAN
ncbi:MAG: SEC-C metal-binding domain-containing protein, partial [Eubacteriales bacterium]|nr:SEC-C metal-binding domain-containing protein [Eubacteriales bacterium]